MGKVLPRDAARHVVVGEHQINVAMGGENPERFVSVHSLQDIVTQIDEMLCRGEPYKDLILNHKDSSANLVRVHIWISRLLPIHCPKLHAGFHAYSAAALAPARLALAAIMVVHAKNVHQQR